MAGQERRRFALVSAGQKKPHFFGGYARTFEPVAGAHGVEDLRLIGACSDKALPAAMHAVQVTIHASPQLREEVVRKWNNMRTEDFEDAKSRDRQGYVLGYAVRMHRIDDNRKR